LLSLRQYCHKCGKWTPVPISLAERLTT
jgi:hypothetical protein